jgi:hypothetical protein
VKSTALVIHTALFLRCYAEARIDQILIVPTSSRCRVRPRRFQKPLGAIMLKKFVSVVAVSCALGISALALPQADQSAKQDMKDAGHATKQAAKDTGSATKKTAKKTGHEVKKDTKKATNKTAAETKKGAQKVEDKTQ